MSGKILNTVKIFLLSLFVLAGYISVSVAHAQASPSTSPSSMPTITIIAPVANSSWDFGNTKTIAWQTTKLLSSVKGQIFLAKKDATSLTGAVLTRYLIVNNLPNTGSYPWSSVGNAYALNKGGLTDTGESCNKTTPPANCYTVATKIPAGIYIMTVWFSADPADIFPTNSLGQYIVEGQPTNIAGMITISSPEVALKIGTIATTTTSSSNTITTTTTTPAADCAAGDKYNATTGKPCVAVALPPGCEIGDLYNGLTGKPCVAGVNPVTPSASSLNQTSQTSANASSSYDFGSVTLRRGSRGVAVMQLQKFLNDDMGLSLTKDGKFGPKTLLEIKKWQNAHGLVADGLVGAKTKAEMMRKVIIKDKSNL